MIVVNILMRNKIIIKGGIYMSLNCSGMNRDSGTKKIRDLSKGSTEAVSEIGFPNNKDKGKGKKGVIVGKG